MYIKYASMVFAWAWAIIIIMCKWLAPGEVSTGGNEEKKTLAAHSRGVEYRQRAYESKSRKKP